MSRKNNNSKAEEDRKKMEEALKAKAAQEQEEANETLGIRGRTKEIGTGATTGGTVKSGVTPGHFSPRGEDPLTADDVVKMEQQGHAAQEIGGGLLSPAGDRTVPTLAATTGSADPFAGMVITGGPMPAKAQGGAGGNFYTSIMDDPKTQKFDVDMVFLDLADDKQLAVAAELSDTAPAVFSDLHVAPPHQIALAVLVMFVVALTRSSLAPSKGAGPLVARVKATSKKVVKIFRNAAGGVPTPEIFIGTVLNCKGALPFSFVGFGKTRTIYLVKSAQRVNTQFGPSCIVHVTPNVPPEHPVADITFQLWMRTTQIDPDQKPVSVAIAYHALYRKEDYNGAASYAIRTFGKYTTVEVTYMQPDRALFQ